MGRAVGQCGILVIPCRSAGFPDREERVSKLPGRITGGVLLALALAVPAKGQSTFELTSPGNTTAFGYYVGPYQAVTIGSSVSSPFSVYCVDFTHDVFVGETWSAYVTTIGGDLSSTRLGAAGIAQYREAAFLAYHFAFTPQSGWGDLAASIWQIMNPGAPGEPAPSTSYWTTYAAAHYLDYGTARYDDVAIITPINKSDAMSAQEFITATRPVTATPEPEETLLLGLGLMSIGVALWWRRQTVA
jgi:hypothetical protein